MLSGAIGNMHTLINMDGVCGHFQFGRGVLVHSPMNIEHSPIIGTYSIAGLSILHCSEVYGVVAVGWSVNQGDPLLKSNKSNSVGDDNRWQRHMDASLVYRTTRSSQQHSWRKMHSPQSWYITATQTHCVKAQHSFNVAGCTDKFNLSFNIRLDRLGEKG